jgi:hypothetical protein
MTWVPPSQGTGVTSAGILKQLLRYAHNYYFRVLSLLRARPGNGSEGSLQRHWEPFVRRCGDTPTQRGALLTCSGKRDILMKEPYAANGPGCRTAKFTTLGQNSRAIGVIRTMAYERCTNRKPALSALSSASIQRRS